jgi:hypothetical protein
MARNYIQGVYDVKNKNKYIGTKNPRFLSSYELAVFEWADRTPAVLKWGAEVVVVNYFNPVKNRKARYIVDLYIQYVNKEGVVKEELIEIKPSNQTIQPRRGKKSERTYLDESLTWATNQAKWEAAEKYAAERGWGFRLLTENGIFR